ncbi:MAG: FAD-dependent oxidoreductase, partial [Clostridia bacterium]|nr:FAD-dependent oxidoreductase [Clostridia bacterium]
MSDSTPNYDVTIIGGGPGGYVAAIRARQLGLRVALVERDRLGGTCLHWGCIPTKTMHRTADLVRSLRRAGEYGIEVEGWRVDYGAVLRRRQQVVDQLAGGVEQLMRANGVDVFRGRGLPTSPRRVLVAGNDGSTATLDTKHLILATGSRSTRPPIPGIDLEGVVDSDGLLGLQELPPSLVVVGGGVVGVEFASILAALGSRVTVLEMLPYILPPVDRELAQRLLVFLRRAGVECHTEARVLAVERAAEGLAVRAETREGERVFTGSVVLVATGRAPEFGGIDLDALGVLHNRGGIRVDETMRTSADGVYAVGDIAGHAQPGRTPNHP